MRELNKKEITKLGKELQEAKIKILLKWGFSTEEIQAITGAPRFVIIELQ